MIEKIICTDLVKNEILHSVKEERNILYTMIQRKANRTGHIWHMTCFLKYVLKGEVHGRAEVTGRGERIRNKLHDELKGNERMLGTERSNTTWYSTESLL
jgi:hypothetical protein